MSLRLVDGSKQPVANPIGVIVGAAVIDRQQCIATLQGVANFVSDRPLSRLTCASNRQVLAAVGDASDRPPVRVYPCWSRHRIQVPIPQLAATVHDARVERVLVERRQRAFFRIGEGRGRPLGGKAAVDVAVDNHAARRREEGGGGVEVRAG